MPKRHREWLAFAADDLGFSKIGLREGYFAKACFHAHQAIEKTLKAYLIYKGKSVPRIHHLIELFKLCDAPWIEGLETELKIVDTFYIPTRYPEGIPGSLPHCLPGKKEAQEAIDLADRVLSLVQANVD